jgi:hypothetical protein
VTLNSKKTSKENMNAIESFLSMKAIYRKEKEVSSREIIINFKARNENYSLNEIGVQYMSQRN